MKNWKFVKTGNDSLITKDGRVNYPDKEIGEINILKRELEGLMRMAQSDKTHDYTKQIEALKKEISEKKNKYAVGNESIEKQEWSMFKGLSKDAEKEVGNANTVSEYNAEIQRLTKKAEELRRMGQGRSAMEVEKQIEKLGKELRELGNKKTGNKIIDLRDPDPTGEVEASAMKRYYKLMDEYEKNRKKVEGIYKDKEGKKYRVYLFGPDSGYRSGNYSITGEGIYSITKVVKDLPSDFVKIGNAWTSADEKRLEELHKKGPSKMTDEEWKEFQELNKRVYREERKALKKIGNSQKEFKSVEELDSWCKQNGYMYEERSNGYYSLTNGKDFTTAHVGNARPKEQLLADVRELTKYIKEHNGQGCEKEKRLLGEAKEELDKNYGIIVGNSKTGNTGHWNSSKTMYAKWDDASGRPADEYAVITWLGEGKGGLVNIWKGHQMTSEKYGSYDLSDLRRWAEQRIGNETLAEYAKSKPRVINGLSRARNAMTKNAMSIADLEAQIKKNEEYIKSLQGKTVDSEGWSAKASIREAQDEIDRMKSRIADLKEQGNKKVGNLDTVEEGDYVTVRFQGELVDGVVRKVQGTQALVTIDNTDVWFPIRSLKESI